MNISRFFIDRPIFAAVLSIVTLILGGIAYQTLPVAQYPEVVPPTIVVQASYPGAPPEVIADTVATPIEQEVNGVEDMLYMSSQSTTDGQMTLTITFRLGTDLDKAQVLVQNRVAIAEPRLPEDVRRVGVTTLKSSPDLLMVVHLLSPTKRYDQLYIGNFALIRVRDALRRLEGVGDVNLFGLREYSMRVWLDPGRLASRNIATSDVVQALREQNVQVASGAVGQAPVPAGHAFQLPVTTLGRLREPEEFENIIVKTGADGRITRVRDVARIELAARDYSVNSYLDNQPAVAMAVAQLPASNALATAEAVERTMEELSRSFPEGLTYKIVYNPTVFVRESIKEVIHTLFEAVGLVVLVVLVFLQTWRASLIPLLAIPVSLVGTIAAMKAFGFSLNMLSLFGLVLAIGIVVDDAIVGAENDGSGRLWDRLCRRSVRASNRVFDRTTHRYGGAVGRLVRRPALALTAYALLFGFILVGFRTIPTGFIPAQDKGYLIVAIQLPDGASLERTDAVVRRAGEVILATPGVNFAVAFAGFSGATRANSANAGAIFVGPKPWDERRHGPTANELLATLQRRLSEIEEASIFVIPPPPVQGLGTSGGFKLLVQDRSGQGLRALQEATDAYVGAARGDPNVARVFTTFRASAPQLYADIDRVKAEKLGVPLANVFDTLQVYLGSVYVNDFNRFGRTFQVRAQAEGAYRAEPEDVVRIKTRNNSDGMVPLGSVVTLQWRSGSDRIVRYNMFPAAEVNGDAAPGESQGTALAAMERLAAQVLPLGMQVEWTDIAYQAKLAGNTAVFIFPLCVLFVFRSEERRVGKECRCRW